MSGWLGVAAAVGAITAQSAPFDFRGIALDSALSEVRARRVEQPQAGRRTFRCSDEPEQVSSGKTSDAERRAGLVRCTYVVTQSYGSFESTTSDFSMLGQGYTADVSYDFVDGRLTTIFVEADLGLASQITDGLVAKFGPPKSIVDQPLETSTGGRITSVTTRWVRGDYAVQVREPYGNRKKLVVFFSAATRLQVYMDRLKADPARQIM